MISKFPYKKYKPNKTPCNVKSCNSFGFLKVGLTQIKPILDITKDYLHFLKEPLK